MPRPLSRALQTRQRTRTGRMIALREHTAGGTTGARQRGSEEGARGAGRWEPIGLAIRSRVSLPGIIRWARCHRFHARCCRGCGGRLHLLLHLLLLRLFSRFQLPHPFCATPHPALRARDSHLVRPGLRLRMFAPVASHAKNCQGCGRGSSAAAGPVFTVLLMPAAPLQSPQRQHSLPLD